MAADGNPTESGAPVDAEVVETSAPEAADATAEAGAADTAAGGHQVAELTADLQRLSAEFANYRKRIAKDVQEARAAGKAAVVAELLVVLDDLERARSHGDLDTGPLKSVSDKLDGVLKAQGLEPFGAVGDDFDPAVHEAVQHEGDGADPVIGVVMRQGYRVGGKVIRTALVGVVDRAPGASAPGVGSSDGSDNNDRDQTSGADA
ncbi:nucleotide exchange factor GrpE [Tsukamurella soli]|uniref:Protein GrpE n=1 Tax=Tsukamurella soli TaxID=644556 RepID=A0ABP8JZG8_9ACTN